MDASLAPINPNPGSERDPRNFVGRAETTERAEVMLRAGQSILLSDPRRMGKTFWMHAFAKQQESLHRYQVLLIDYESTKSTEDFLLKTAQGLTQFRSLPKRVWGQLGVLFENVEGTATVGPLQLKAAVRSSGRTPLAMMEGLLTELDSEVSKETKPIPLVIAMDEVPDAVMSIARMTGKDDAFNLLHSLRHLRSTTRNTRWIIAGSVGLHHVLAAVGATSAVTNDLSPLAFGPLTREDAEQLSIRLALGIKRPEITPEALGAIIELTSAIPSIIQKLFDMMRYDQAGRSAARTIIDVQEVRDRLDDFINDRDQSGDVAHYLTRIESYYGPTAALAIRILDYMAQAEGQVPFVDLEEHIKMSLQRDFDRELFLTTYGNLCDDHYIAEQASGGQPKVAWRYSVIRTIYRQRRKLG